MPRETWDTRPAWWPDWIPIRCPSCNRPLLPGVVTASWVHCPCPGAGVPRGHSLWICQCHHEFWPPEHSGEESPEPPRA